MVGPPAADLITDQLSSYHGTMDTTNVQDSGTGQGVRRSAALKVPIIIYLAMLTIAAIFLWL